MHLSNKAVLSVGLLMVPVPLTGTTADKEEEQPIYAAINLSEGLPDFEPLKMMMPAEAFSARIPDGELGPSVHFTWGKDGKEHRFFLYLVYPDGKRSVRGFVLDASEDGTLSGTVEFNSEADSEDLIPIAFRLLPEYRLLLYRWAGSPSPATGGQPTVKDSPLKLGAPIPELTFSTVQGDSISTRDSVGKILVVNWWATTCLPCIAEMPGLNELVERFKPSGQVEFLAVALDEPETLVRFLKRHEFDYDHALGSSDHTEIFGETFPRHVVVDGNGIVAFDRRGAGSQIPTEIGKAVQSLLADNEA